MSRHCETTMARKPAECGTLGGYGRHQREKTEVCPRCAEANRVYKREWDRARRTSIARAARASAAAETRARAEQAARARREAPVLAAHFAGELVLGGSDG
jgi:hypothetical protein